ncbi:hypothetical protein G3I40_29540 [Streptomyces sp. SID14478]|nr:hypothetical protein [Streptomyces sp. SID14478]
MLFTAHALVAGWQPRPLHRQLVREGWRRVRAGAWAEPGPGADVDLRTCLLAEQLLCPQLVVSHLAAAALWRIETLDIARPAPEFIDPTLRTRSNGSRRRVHRMRLAPSDVQDVRGLRVTTPARTLADLLLSGPRDLALVAVESALTYRTVGRGHRRAPLLALHDVTAALPARHRHAARTREWLSLVDPKSGSPAETVARLHMADAGLRPESQAEVFTGDGRQVRLDFLFRAEGLAVEVEGYAYHGTREHHRRDIDRFNRIQRCPEVRSLLRFSALDVFRRPAHFVAEIRAALHRGAGFRQPPPSP